MIIYLDDDFKCHVLDDGAMTSYETDFFDDKCQTFIEGYRFVPEEAEWTRPDGIVFRGLMVSPWKPYTELQKAQFEYELAQLKGQNAEYEAALSEIETALSVV